MRESRDHVGRVPERGICDCVVDDVHVALDLAFIRAGTHNKRIAPGLRRLTASSGLAGGLVPILPEPLSAH